MNNWSDTADGYMKASQQYYGYWSQIFFVAFTLICNMIVLNILIALILDCTGLVKEECAAELEASKDGQPDEGEEGEAKASSNVDVLAKLVGAEEESSEEDSDASSEESGAELDESMTKSMTATSSMARKKKGGAKKSLAPDLTRQEKKTFDNRQAVKTAKKGRKSIG